MSRGPVAIFNYPLPDEIYLTESSSSSRHRRGTTPSTSHRSSAPRYIPTPTIDPKKLLKQFPASPPDMEESSSHYSSSGRLYSSDDRRDLSSGSTTNRKRPAPIIHQREYREPEFDLERTYSRDARRQTVSSIPSRHYSSSSSNDNHHHHHNNNYYHTSPAPAPYTLMSSSTSTTFPPSPPTSPGSMSSSSPFFSQHSPMSPGGGMGGSGSGGSGGGTIPLSSTTTTSSTGRYYCQHGDCIDPDLGISRKSFSRRADLQRHHTSTHEETRFSCTKPNCSRKGVNGFTRHDHLVEHRRGFHKEDVPKRNRGSH